MRFRPQTPPSVHGRGIPDEPCLVCAYSRVAQVMARQHAPSNRKARASTGRRIPRPRTSASPIHAQGPQGWDKKAVMDSLVPRNTTHPTAKAIQNESPTWSEKGRAIGKKETKETGTEGTGTE
jgi:hypothetical protein